MAEGLAREEQLPPRHDSRLAFLLFEARKQTPGEGHTHGQSRTDRQTEIDAILT